MNTTFLVSSGPHRVRQRAALVSIFACLPALLCAQVAINSATAPNKPDDEAAIVLNPFVVSTEKDTGYAASTTLAGPRLNTPVKDIGASVSIYTKDFLTDIGATNISDLLIYATGMETGGPGGNFSNGTGGNIDNDRIVGDGSRNSPPTQNRTRGLAGPNCTRGYFTSDYGFDGYGRKIWKNKIDWKASLQVRNAFRSGGDLIPVTVQPNGRVASYRLAPEQRIYLSNTFSF